VLDGDSWAQESGVWDHSPVITAHSAFLTYGPAMLDWHEEQWGHRSLVFSPHFYREWVFGDSKMIDFLDRCEAAGLALLVGEYGVYTNADTMEATYAMGRVAFPRGIGRIVWHWWGGDRNDLTTSGNGGGWHVDRTDGTKPTNLTALGEFVWADNHAPAGEIIFADDFGPASAGERQDNLVGLPPPRGLGYQTDIHFGQRPLRWIYVDKYPLDDPRRGFWVVLPEEKVLVQAGRGLVTALFADTPLPADVRRYRIEFDEHRYDNDPIGYILGASTPALEHDGVMIQHETQTPGTDETTPHLFVRGALGQSHHADAAGMYRWVRTVIEVDHDHVRWWRDDRLIAEGRVPALRSGGYFGIFQSSERNTRWDNVRILRLPAALPSAATTATPAASP
jgi:hypothetical protein